MLHKSVIYLGSTLTFVHPNIYGLFSTRNVNLLKNCFGLQNQLRYIKNLIE